MNAWSMMLWPLMLADPKGKNVKNKFPLYIGIQVRLQPHKCEVPIPAPMIHLPLSQ